MNGPTGLLVAGGKGVLRTLYCHRDMVADLIPVDVCINLLVAVAWKTATVRSRALSAAPNSDVSLSATFLLVALRVDGPDRTGTNPFSVPAGQQVRQRGGGVQLRVRPGEPRQVVDA